MKITILDSYEKVKNFIYKAQESADTERKSLGFIPKSGYEKSAYQGKLWIAINDQQEYIGHLMFGGKIPQYKIFQLYINSEYRKYGTAKKLIEALVEYCEIKNIVSIVADVASDLPANTFWEKAGFQLVDQKEGGKTTGRFINIRVRELNTPSLFNWIESDTKKQDKGLGGITYRKFPLLQSNRYVMDFEVLLDLTHRKEAYEKAKKIFMGGLNNIIQICVTNEFFVELAKNKEVNEGPIVEILRTLPRLPKVDLEILNPIVEELRNIVFPSRALKDKITRQKESTLLHLA